MKCTLCEKKLDRDEIEANIARGRDEYSNFFCFECEDVPVTK